MDAKTMRAALAAAVRVTVSTSLIGCGGSVSTTNDTADAPATGGTTPRAAQQGVQPSQPPSSGGAPANPLPPTGGVATGGAPASGGSAGDARLGGDGGGGSAGAPVIDSCEPVEACQALLEALEPELGEALPSEARACCELVVSELKAVEPPNGEGPWGISECGAKIEQRFEQTPAKAQCCRQTSWPPLRSHACTPWGPPVPPELPLGALLAWEAAA